jgi:hypothetical protein
VSLKIRKGGGGGEEVASTAALRRRSRERSCGDAGTPPYLSAALLVGCAKSKGVGFITGPLLHNRGTRTHTHTHTGRATTHVPLLMRRNCHSCTQVENNTRELLAKQKGTAMSAAVSLPRCPCLNARRKVVCPVRGTRFVEARHHDEERKGVGGKATPLLFFPFFF